MIGLPRRAGCARPPLQARRYARDAHPAYRRFSEFDMQRHRACWQKHQLQVPRIECGLVQFLLIHVASVGTLAKDLDISNRRQAPACGHHHIDGRQLAALRVTDAANSLAILDNQLPVLQRRQGNLAEGHMEVSGIHPLPPCAADQHKESSPSCRRESSLARCHTPCSARSN